MEKIEIEIDRISLQGNSHFWKKHNSCNPKTLLYGSSKKSLSAKSECSRLQWAKTRAQLHKLTLPKLTLPKLISVGIERLAKVQKTKDPIMGLWAEELDSTILKESIQEKFGEISYPAQSQSKFAVNPLREMQPYAYLADPNEPSISPDDWEMNQDIEVNDL